MYLQTRGETCDELDCLPYSNVVGWRTRCHSVENKFGQDASPTRYPMLTGQMFKHNVNEEITKPYR